MSENALAPQQNEKYVRGVSFDTMTDQDQPDLSFTLRGKIQGYQRTRRSRTFLVATDLANYSDYALNWAIEVDSNKPRMSSEERTNWLALGIDGRW
jgi:hypothetical protein